MSSDAEEKPGRIVEFSTVLQPGSAFRLMPPAERTENTLEKQPQQEPLSRGTKGGLMFMRILAMSETERRAVAADAAALDPMVVWWSLLTIDERKEFLSAATRDLKERIV